MCVAVASQECLSDCTWLPNGQLSIVCTAFCDKLSFPMPPRPERAREVAIRIARSAARGNRVALIRRQMGREGDARNGEPGASPAPAARCHGVERVAGAEQEHYPGPQRGRPKRGLSQRGLSQRGRPQRSEPQRGLSHQGLSHQGLSQRGLSQRGLSQRGRPHQGRPHRGSPLRSHPQRGHPQRSHPQRSHPHWS
jgi:hypothetical protein